MTLWLWSRFGWMLFKRLGNTTLAFLAECKLQVVAVFNASWCIWWRNWRCTLVWHGSNRESSQLPHVKYEHCGVLATFLMVEMMLERLLEEKTEIRMNTYGVLRILVHYLSRNIFYLFHKHVEIFIPRQMSRSPQETKLIPSTNHQTWICWQLIIRRATNNFEIRSNIF